MYNKGKRGDSCKDKDLLLTWTDMEETVHNLICFWSVTSCGQEHSLEEARDGLELARVKLIYQCSLVYQITNDGALVIQIGIH